MLRTSGLVCGLLVLVVGCGGDNTESEESVTIPSGTAALTETTKPVSDNSEATSPVATTAEANDVVELTVGPCDLVSAADVEEATGLAVVTVDDITLEPTGCVFDVGLSADVFVEIETGEGSFGGPHFLFTNYMDLADDGTAELVADLGVAAVYSPGFRGLAVDAGDGRFVAVGLNGGYPEELAEPRDALVALASAAIAQL